MSKQSDKKVFLEICSSNRDRNKFPYPSQFEVLLGVPNNQPSKNIDPILGGCSYFLWTGGQGVSGASGATGINTQAISNGNLKCNGKNVSGGGSDGTLFLNQTAQNPGYYNYYNMPYGYDINDIQTILWPDPNSLDFYNGYRINIGQAGGNTGESRIITGYNMSEGSVTVNTSFTQGVVLANTPYYISDPSIISQIHLPSVDGLGNKISTYDQAYDNYYIVDETLSTDTTIVYAQIFSYDAYIHDAFCAFPDQWKFDPNWTAARVMSLKKDLYNAKYICMPGSTGTTNGGVIYLPPYLTYGTGYFEGQYFVNTGIVGLYDTNGRILSQCITPTVTTVAPTTVVRKDIPASSNANSVYYCTFYSGYPENKLIYSTIVGIPQNNLPPNTNVQIPNETAIFSDIVAWSPLIMNNFQPLRYNGTIASNNEVSYEVACISLTLPNVTLESGSRIALQYPYVYVQLSPITSPGAYSQNLIYSNNPQSNTAVFTVAMKDTTNPIATQFIKGDGGQMVQTINTKPNENWAFSVFLPNGELFLPYKSDKFSPFPADQLLQIEAVFSFKRL